MGCAKARELLGGAAERAQQLLVELREGAAGDHTDGHAAEHDALKVLIH